MRDPNRIDPFMDLVKKTWKDNCPDWRFGQFICNIFDEIGSQVFYMEEPEMLQSIEDYFNKRKEDNKNG